MSGAVTTAGLAPILVGCAVAALLLRRSWRQAQDKTVWRAGGWTLVALMLCYAVWRLGGGRGVFAVFALMPVAALGVIASGATWRPARLGRPARGAGAVEPAERVSGIWRGVARWSLAGPVGMVAAMAVGISYAVWAPGAMQTRLLIGGLLVPVAWAAAMAWTLADSRIVRASAVLGGTAVAGFGAAMLRGLA